MARRDLRMLAVGALLVSLFVLLRCMDLDADPPLAIGPHAARELFAEPPAKSHEARNFALFGRFHVHPEDDYQFWRVQSPVWVYPLAHFFRAFGVSYPVLRLFSTLYSALGLVALLLISRRYLSTRALWFVGIVLATDSVYFHVSRAGFLEPAVASWICVAVLFLMLGAQKHVAFLLCAHWAFAAAFFTKQAALHAVPVLFVGTVFALWNCPGGENRKMWRALVLGHIVVLCSLTALYVTRDAYYRTVVHNVNHVLLGSDAGPGDRFRGVISVWTRLTDVRRYQHFLLSAPWSGPLALLTTCGWMYSLARGRRLSAGALFSGLWFLGALGSMLIVAKSALRFWSVVVPPAALVAAMGVDALLLAREARGRTGRRVAFSVLLAGVLALNAYGYSRHVLHPRHTVRDAAAALQHAIGERDATIVGLTAPGVVLATPYKNYYVRGGFNQGSRKLSRLGITHLLSVPNDPSLRIIKRAFPRVLKGLRPIAVFPLRDQHVSLFGVVGRLIRADARGRAAP